MPTLKGLTWDHPRGYAPLVAGAREFQQSHPDIKVHWDRRTLREFGEAPIEQYVSKYDLIIIDHPFVGFAAAHGALVDLGPYLTDAETKRLSDDSAGPSWESYLYADGLWALPIDAATQVASYRPDLLPKLSPEIPSTLESVFSLAETARKAGNCIVVAACPTDAICLFFTLNASRGNEIREDSDPFIQPALGREILVLLRALIDAAHPKSVDWSPIQVYDFMTSSSEAIYCPYAYGYSNYCRDGRWPKIRFTNAPAAGHRGSSGTMLGGTGIAISAASPHVKDAVLYAKWLVSQEHQRGTYFQEGGQPASLAAWLDPKINSRCNNFFLDTLPTLVGAYLRPRFDGLVRFFEFAGIEINRFLRRDRDTEQLIRALNERYALARKDSRNTKQGSFA